LFWDEQLSSDNTMACGTCHRPEHGGTDPRAHRNAGPDGEALTEDDGFGSPGTPIPRAGRGSILDEVLSGNRHVTARLAPSNLMAAYAPELFWDGRAPGAFRDPVSGAVRIAKGGALESQSVVPILNSAEMAHPGRTWDDVVKKLRGAKPLALASDLPADLRRALEARPSYPELFAAAFGANEITPERIAFAIASYQRTLIPDQTPYDRFVAGERDALTENQRRGFRYFRGLRCAECHSPPWFTDHSYRNIGVRPLSEDPGRAAVTGKSEDRGKFKVPSLRNVGIRPRFMHTGEFSALNSSLRVYRFPRRGNQIDPLLNHPIHANPQGNDQTPLMDFLRHALTDPRVVKGLPPFDRPKLQSERQQALAKSK
ncbi:MAG: hypothetical protein KDC87_21200, partial [Planctomycetes bacterium]|nr:hypothetical protein [Planctomycetota bacterium]